MQFCTHLIHLSFFFFFSSAFFFSSSSSAGCRIRNFIEFCNVSTHTFPCRGNPQSSSVIQHAHKTLDEPHEAPRLECASHFTPEGFGKNVWRLSPDENKQKAHYDASSRVAQCSICIAVLKGPCKQLKQILATTVAMPLAVLARTCVPSPEKAPGELTSLLYERRMDDIP